MKKTLIALAAVAATGASFAQVTLYGTLDAAYVRNDSEGMSKTQIANSQLRSSKLGFMGTEQIEGGLNAVFKLEAGVGADSGAGTATSTNNQAAATTAFAFNRAAYLGLQGGFGEVRVGRETTSTFDTIGAVDPFSTNGPADSTAFTLNLGTLNPASTGATTNASVTAVAQATAVRASNMIGYITPVMAGGFTGKIQAFFGEKVSTATTGTTASNDDGNGYSAQIAYANGPIYAALAQQVTKGTFGTAAFGDYTQRGLSASYDFGTFKLAYTHAHEGLVINADGNEATNNSDLLGVTVPMGKTMLKASYIRAARNQDNLSTPDNVGRMWALGADYALSARTKVYGVYARSTNEDGLYYGVGGFAQNTTTNNPGTTSYGFGVSHAF